MAKKKNSSLRATEAQTAPQKTVAVGTLPDYAPYLIVAVLNSKIPLKIWFEENCDTWKTTKDAGLKLYKGGLSKKHLMSEEARLPKDMKIDLVRAFIQWASQAKRGVKTIQGTYENLLGFIEWASENQIYSWENIKHFSLMNFYIANKYSRDVGEIFNILGRAYGIPALHLKDSRPTSVRRTKNKSSPEDLFQESDFSDETLMQILGFTLYHLNLMFNRNQEFNEVSETELERDGVLIQPEDLTSWKYPKDGDRFKTLFEIYESNPDQAINLIFKNLLLGFKREIFKNFELEMLKGPEAFVSRVLRFIAAKNRRFYEDIRTYFIRKYEISPDSKAIFFPRFLSQNRPVNQAAILLFVLLQTGVNKEVALSLKRHYDGVHWKKRHDIELGSDAQAALKRRVLRLTGYKTRGKHGKKPVDIRVPVDSFLYKVLELAEQVYASPEQNNFFGEASKWRGRGLTEFCSQYEILEGADRLKYVNTTRIRKCFAGAQLSKAIQQAGSNEDLARHLRDALNHESFDTTVFSYLMKTGVGNFVFSSAVVALTTKMIEDALKFKGRIISTSVADQHESNKKIPVFLCDCEDPTKPTHDVPIAKRCREYDLCLGCERSQVHAEHVSRVCYRIFQYDAIPSPASDVLTDRKAIALDLIERFRAEHPDGELIVETSYLEASEAFKSNKPLLPELMM